MLNEARNEIILGPYSTWALRDFSTHIAQHIGYANARKAILNLYSGEPHDYWVLIELSECFPYIISHRAGVQFLYKIIRKTKTLIKPLLENIHSSYLQLLNYPAGCRILYDCFDSFNEEGKISMEIEAFRRVPDAKDPEFITLVCMLIQALMPDQRMLRPLMNISLYQANNNIVNIGRTILEFSDRRITIPFQNEITKNLMQLIEDPVLHALIVSMIYTVPMQEKLAIYQTIYSFLPTMVSHPFQWHLIQAFICVLPMKEKNYLAQIISSAINGAANGFIPPHYDGLIRCAIESIDSKSRLDILKRIEFAYKNPNFPEFTEYLDGLTVMLSGFELLSK